MFGDKPRCDRPAHMAGRGPERFAHLLATQRDLYNSINDHPLRPQSITADAAEIAETPLHMPASPRGGMVARGYYGSSAKFKGPNQSISSGTTPTLPTSYPAAAGRETRAKTVNTWAPPTR